MTRPLIPHDVILRDYRDTPWGGYKVSYDGRLASDKRAGYRGYPDGWYERKVSLTDQGERTVSLSDGPNRTTCSLGSLILEAWGFPRPHDESIAVFKDGDRSNVRLDNLEWATRQGLMDAMTSDGRHRCNPEACSEAQLRRQARLRATRPPETERQCKGECGRIHPIEEFGWTGRRRISRKHLCKQCESQRLKRWRAAFATVSG
jgi:hypothetical protein